jgi:hypothetical protein
MLSAIISRTAAPEVGAAPLPCLGQRTLGVQVDHDQVARAARDAYVRQSHGHVVMTKPGRFYPSVSAVLMTCACLLLAGLAVTMGIVSWHAQFAYVFVGLRARSGLGHGADRRLRSWGWCDHRGSRVITRLA